MIIASADTSCHSAPPTSGPTIAVIPDSAATSSTSTVVECLESSSSNVASSSSRERTDGNNDRVDETTLADVIDSDSANRNMKAPVSAFPHLVFGYGSLICPESRAITAPSTVGREVLPVQIHNVERTWAKKSVRGMTSMGVRFRDGADCVGVLVPVTNKELRQFDRREKGYYRAQLELDAVAPVPFLDPEFYQATFLEEAAVAIAQERENKAAKEDNETFNASEDDDSCDTNKDSSDTAATESSSDSSTDSETEGEKEEFKPKIWVYVQKRPTPPSELYPIAQTYVDIILRGCLTISEQFAREFIETTKGWHPCELLEDKGDANHPVKYIDVIEHDMKKPASELPDVAWVDDRRYPIYMRADVEYSLEYAEEIDGLLKEHLEEYMEKRRRLRRRRRVPKKASAAATATKASTAKPKAATSKTKTASSATKLTE